jgi:hypothetical protein
MESFAKSRSTTATGLGRDVQGTWPARTVEVSVPTLLFDVRPRPGI